MAPSQSKQIIKQAAGFTFDGITLDGTDCEKEMGERDEHAGARGKKKGGTRSRAYGRSHPKYAGSYF